MFHLQAIELLHWDYCQRLTLPLDGAIITVAGPNGSGKTTLLDAMRTLLGLDCSGGRSYKTYARHANADASWLRAVVDNRPRTRQASSRPFARCLLYADQVTLACRIQRNGGDWQRRYCMVEGDVPIETLLLQPEKEWLGIEHWRRRLEGAGLSRAIARVLALEQGQTDRLCEYSPKELLRLVFDVFGDQEVLDRYEDARQHQRDVLSEVEATRTELAHSVAQLAQLDARLNLYRQYQDKLRERERLSTEVIPVLAWHEDRAALADGMRELHRQRLQHAAGSCQRQTDRQSLLRLAQDMQTAEQQAQALDRERQEAQAALVEAGRNEKPVEQLIKEADELLALSQVEGDATQLAQQLQTLEAQRQELDGQWHRLTQQRDDAQASLDALRHERAAPPPDDVARFRRVLRNADIEHHVLADVIDIRDDHWRAAAEGVLRGSRWVVVLADPRDESRAMQLAAQERYRHYLVADAIAAPAQPPADSLLSVLRMSAPVPAWLVRQLSQIQRVANTAEGIRVGGEWITPQAYWRDGRGGRSVWVDPSQFQFGSAALQARRQALQRRVAELDGQLQELAEQQQQIRRQHRAAEQATKGMGAAETLARRAEEFEQARRQLPQVQQARRNAAERWQDLDTRHHAAIASQHALRTSYEQTQARLRDSDAAAARHEREWDANRRDLSQRARRSRERLSQFPARWVRPETIQALRDAFTNAKLAGMRLDDVQHALDTGEWETDPSVEERHTLMTASVGAQQNQLRQREASNEAARVAVDNARERYIDVLRATVRRYRRNIVELGQLAGVEVSADLPHLDNDDVVLRQAELKVNFNFDGKGQIGLNDGEASGGQQVIKSLILLVGLLKDDESTGGFVFIDEPFAHLDVRNIQLVGHFLKSTRAQYVLTTPITHNVEVFEPADITLVTSKKPRGARWAPPIGVLQRRAETA